MSVTLEAELNAAPPMPAVNVTDKTVVVTITCGAIGNSRKVATSEIQIDADKDLIRVTKQLLDSPELKAIGHHDGQTRTEIVSLALPSFFRSGFYLVPIAAIERVQKILTEAKDKREELVEAFLKVYQQRKTEAEERLKGQFNSSDYPMPSRVRQQFIFEWSWVSFATPGRLKEISAAFFQQEQSKAAQQWQQATEEITLLLRTQLKDLVDHMLERLAPADDGKKKKFHSSSVTKVKEFLENFSIRNVTSDAELEMIVNSAKQLLSGIDPDSIRNNEAVRDNAEKGFQMLKACLDPLVVEAGSRKILLDDDAL
jgi:hypothetical protein